MITIEEARLRVEKVLRSEPTADELTALAAALRDEGLSQVALYKLFTHYFEQMDGDEPHYDAVAETLVNTVSGQWAKGNELFTTELREKDIDRMSL